MQSRSQQMFDQTWNNLKDIYKPSPMFFNCQVVSMAVITWGCEINLAAKGLIGHIHVMSLNTKQSGSWQDNDESPFTSIGLQ